MMNRLTTALSPEELANIRREAHLLLKKAGAHGRFPTPIDDIVGAARLSVQSDVSLDVGFLDRLYRQAKSGIKKALTKVLGLFDSRDSAIYLDQTIYPPKRRFITLHETGHGVLPWQRAVYAVMEDCDSNLDADIKDRFEYEANVFASEVLFQGDAFERDAADSKFGLRTPIGLAKRYGSSIYAAVRRYVETSPHACLVLVLDLPESPSVTGYRLKLRRAVGSPKLREEIGELGWPQQFTAGDPIGAMLPLEPRRRFSGPRICEFRDTTGEAHRFMAEAFNSHHQVFVLLLRAHSGRVSLTA